MLFISGQVNRELTTNFTESKLRQLGDQEFNIVKTVENMTKLAVQINDPQDIKYYLQKACKTAMSGRPGPVWLDIPLNVQSADIDFDKTKSFDEEINTVEPSEFEIQNVIEKWNKSKNPLLIVGNGVRLSGAVSELKQLLSKTHVPVISAINGNDIVNSDYPYYYGRFGTHAQICANKLLNECDFVLSIGSRLYVRQTGYNFTSFAKNAYKIYVDIDPEELNKSTLFPDQKIVSDAKLFIKKLLNKEIALTCKSWISKCDEFNKSPKVLNRHRDKKDFVSNYFLIEKLSELLPSDHHVITSDGSANVVTMQVLNLKGNQRLITNTGCAPMGYGLPAAIGAAINHKIICLEGDGSLHLNVHELQTMKHYNLPIKLILINNDGYLSIKTTQKAFFNGKFVASEKNSGVSFPKFEKIVSAYELPYCSIKNNSEIESVLSEFLKQTGPCVCEVFTDPEEYHEPKVIAKLGSDGEFIPGSLENIQWVEPQS